MEAVVKEIPEDSGMIVKRVSVPIGLEELMEGLAKEVLLKKPKDIYIFASEYFSRLVLLREQHRNVYPIRSVQSVTHLKPAEKKVLPLRPTKHLSRQMSVRNRPPEKFPRKSPRSKEQDEEKKPLQTKRERSLSTKKTPRSNASSNQNTPREQRQRSTSKPTGTETKNSSSDLRSSSKAKSKKTGTVSAESDDKAKVQKNTIQTNVNDKSTIPLRKATRSEGENKAKHPDTPKVDDIVKSENLYIDLVKVRNISDTDRVRSEAEKTDEPLDSDIWAKSTNIEEVSKRINGNNETVKTNVNETMVEKTEAGESTAESVADICSDSKREEVHDEIQNKVEITNRHDQSRTDIEEVTNAANLVENYIQLAPDTEEINNTVEEQANSSDSSIKQAENIYEGSKENGQSTKEELDPDKKLKNVKQNNDIIVGVDDDKVKIHMQSTDGSDELLIVTIPDRSENSLTKSIHASISPAEVPIETSHNQEHKMQFFREDQKVGEKEDNQVTPSTVKSSKKPSSQPSSEVNFGQKTEEEVPSQVGHLTFNSVQELLDFDSKKADPSWTSEGSGESTNGLKLIIVDNDSSSSSSGKEEIRGKINTTVDEIEEIDHSDDVHVENDVDKVASYNEDNREKQEEIIELNEKDHTEMNVLHKKHDELSPKLIAANEPESQKSNIDALDSSDQLTDKIHNIHKDHHNIHEDSITKIESTEDISEDKTGNSESTKALDDATKDVTIYQASPNVSKDEDGSDNNEIQTIEVKRRPKLGDIEQVATVIEVVKNIFDGKSESSSFVKDIRGYLNSFLEAEQQDLFKNKEDNKNESAINSSKERSLKISNLYQEVDTKASSAMKIRRTRSVGIIKTQEETKSKIPTPAGRSAGRRPLVRQLETTSKELEEKLNFKRSSGSKGSGNVSQESKKTFSGEKIEVKSKEVSKEDEIRENEESDRVTEGTERDSNEVVSVPANTIKMVIPAKSELPIDNNRADIEKNLQKDIEAKEKPSIPKKTIKEKCQDESTTENVIDRVRQKPEENLEESQDEPQKNVMTLHDAAKDALTVKGTSSAVEDDEEMKSHGAAGRYSLKAGKNQNVKVKPAEAQEDSLTDTNMAARGGENIANKVEAITKEDIVNEVEVELEREMKDQSGRDKQSIAEKMLVEAGKNLEKKEVANEDGSMIETETAIILDHKGKEGNLEQNISIEMTKLEPSIDEKTRKEQAYGEAKKDASIEKLERKINDEPVKLKKADSIVDEEGFAEDIPNLTKKNIRIVNQDVTSNAVEEKLEQVGKEQATQKPINDKTLSEGKDEECIVEDNTKQDVQESTAEIIKPANNSHKMNEDMDETMESKSRRDISLGTGIEEILDDDIEKSSTKVTEKVQVQKMMGEDKNAAKKDIPSPMNSESEAEQKIMPNKAKVVNEDPMTSDEKSSEENRDKYKTIHQVTEDELSGIEKTVTEVNGELEHKIKASSDDLASIATNKKNITNENVVKTDNIPEKVEEHSVEVKKYSVEATREDSVLFKETLSGIKAESNKLQEESGNHEENLDHMAKETDQIAEEDALIAKKILSGVEGAQKQIELIEERLDKVVDNRGKRDNERFRPGKSDSLVREKTGDFLSREQQHVFKDAPCVSVLTKHQTDASVAEQRNYSEREGLHHVDVETGGIEDTHSIIKRSVGVNIKEAEVGDGQNKISKAEGEENKKINNSDARQKTIQGEVDNELLHTERRNELADGGEEHYKIVESQLNKSEEKTKEEIVHQDHEVANVDTDILKTDKAGEFINGNSKSVGEKANGDENDESLNIEKDKIEGTTGNDQYTKTTGDDIISLNKDRVIYSQIDTRDEISRDGSNKSMEGEENRKGNEIGNVVSNSQKAIEGEVGKEVLNQKNGENCKDKSTKDVEGHNEVFASQLYQLKENTENETMVQSHETRKTGTIGTVILKTYNGGVFDIGNLTSVGDEVDDGNDKSANRENDAADETTDNRQYRKAGDDISSYNVANISSEVEIFKVGNNEAIGGANEIDNLIGISHKSIEGAVEKKEGKHDETFADQLHLDEKLKNETMYQDHKRSENAHVDVIILKTDKAGEFNNVNLKIADHKADDGKDTSTNSENDGVENIPTKIEEAEVVYGQSDTKGRKLEAGSNGTIDGKGNIEVDDEIDNSINVSKVATKLEFEGGISTKEIGGGEEESNKPLADQLHQLKEESKNELGGPYHAKSEVSSACTAILEADNAEEFKNKNLKSKDVETVDDEKDKVVNSQNDETDRATGNDQYSSKVDDDIAVLNEANIPTNTKENDVRYSHSDTKGGISKAEISVLLEGGDNKEVNNRTDNLMSVSHRTTEDAGNQKMLNKEEIDYNCKTFANHLQQVEGQLKNGTMYHTHEKSEIAHVDTGISETDEYGEFNKNNLKIVDQKDEKGEGEKSENDKGHEAGDGKTVGDERDKALNSEHDVTDIITSTGQYTKKTDDDIAGFHIVTMGTKATEDAVDQKILNEKEKDFKNISFGVNDEHNKSFIGQLHQVDGKLKNESMGQNHEISEVANIDKTGELNNGNSIDDEADDDEEKKVSDTENKKANEATDQCSTKASDDTTNFNVANLPNENNEASHVNSSEYAGTTKDMGAGKTDMTRLKVETSGGDADEIIAKSPEDPDTNFEKQEDQDVDEVHDSDDFREGSNEKQNKVKETADVVPQHSKSDTVGQFKTESRNGEEGESNVKDMDPDGNDVSKKIKNEIDVKRPKDIKVNEDEHTVNVTDEKEKIKENVAIDEEYDRISVEAEKSDGKKDKEIDEIAPQQSEPGTVEHSEIKHKNGEEDESNVKDIVSEGNDVSEKIKNEIEMKRPQDINVSKDELTVNMTVKKEEIKENVAIDGGYDTILVGAKESGEKIGHIILQKSESDTVGQSNTESKHEENYESSVKDTVSDGHYVPKKIEDGIDMKRPEVNNSKNDERTVDMKDGKEKKLEINENGGYDRIPVEAKKSNGKGDEETGYIVLQQPEPSTVGGSRTESRNGEGGEINLEDIFSDGNDVLKKMRNEIDMKRPKDISANKDERTVNLMDEKGENKTNEATDEGHDRIPVKAEERDGKEDKETLDIVPQRSESDRVEYSKTESTNKDDESNVKDEINIKDEINMTRQEEINANKDKYTVNMKDEINENVATAEVHDKVPLTAEKSGELSEDIKGGVSKDRTKDKTAKLRVEKAAVKIQSTWKGFVARKLLRKTEAENKREKAIVKIQAAVRKFLERLKVDHLNRNIVVEGNFEENKANIENTKKELASEIDLDSMPYDSLEANDEIDEPRFKRSVTTDNLNLIPDEDKPEKNEITEKQVGGTKDHTSAEDKGKRDRTIREKRASSDIQKYPHHLNLDNEEVSINASADRAAGLNMESRSSNTKNQNNTRNGINSNENDRATLENKIMKTVDSEATKNDESKLSTEQEESNDGKTKENEDTTSELNRPHFYRSDTVVEPACIKKNFTHLNDEDGAQDDNNNTNKKETALEKDVKAAVKEIVRSNTSKTPLEIEVSQAVKGIMENNPDIDAVLGQLPQVPSDEISETLLNYKISKHPSGNNDQKLCKTNKDSYGSVESNEKDAADDLSSIGSVDSVVTVIVKPKSATKTESKKLTSKALSTSALEDHVELLDQVQNSLLDQLSGKPVANKFDIDELRRELNETPGLYDRGEQHLISDEMDYLYDFEPEDDQRTPVRELPDIAEDEEDLDGIVAKLSNDQHNEIIINNDHIESNQKLLHTSEFHDSLTIPKLYKEQADQLKHTSEFHDTVVVPLPRGADVKIKNASSQAEISGNQTSAQQPPAGVEAVTRPSREVVEAQASLKDAAPARFDSVRAATDDQSQSAVSRAMESGAGERNNNRRNNNAIVGATEKTMEAEAATKIQAGFRGYQVRKQLKSKNTSSDQKRQLRKRSSRDNIKDQDLEEKSAVKIQAGVRGFLVRRRQKKQGSSASA